MIGAFCFSECEYISLKDEKLNTSECGIYCKLCNKPVIEIDWNDCPAHYATKETEYEECANILRELKRMGVRFAEENGKINMEMIKDEEIVNDIDVFDSNLNIKSSLSKEERLVLSKIQEKLVTKFLKYYTNGYDIENDEFDFYSKNNSSATQRYSSSSSYSSSQSKQSSQFQQQCVPKCPTCGSTNVAPISTGKKMLGLLTLGLASKGIGKSYCCKNCGYYW